MADLVRPEGERDPEGIGEYIPTGELPQGGAAALREMWYELRARGTMSGTTLQSVGWDSVDENDHSVDGADGWWVTTRPYLRSLPGVIPPGESESGKWKFDPSAPMEPPEPEPVADARTPSVEQAAAFVDDLEPRQALRDAHGDPIVPAGVARTDRALRRAYESLIEHGEAESADLFGFYEPGEDGHLQQGRFASKAEWWRRAGRRLFAQLPGVAEPAAGAPWRFVGVSEDEAEGDDREERVGAVAVREAIAAVNPPGREPWTSRRRESIRTLVDRLSEAEAGVEPVPVDDLLADVPAHDLGYTDASSYWEWADGVLADLPGVEVTEDDDGAEVVRLTHE